MHASLHFLIIFWLLNQLLRIYNCSYDGSVTAHGGIMPACQVQYVPDRLAVRSHDLYSSFLPYRHPDVLREV
jgi:hypothetical protein